ncbi:DUF2515 domain-containing protein [Paenibacillus sp. TRM 82003]|nr:DUF2515 domain-containing protein [Paenibacillus sp. TRM 82003]
MRTKSGLQALMERIAGLPGAWLQAVSALWNVAGHDSASDIREIRVNRSEWKRLRRALRSISSEAATAAETMPGIPAGVSVQGIVERISKETRKENRNNATRTNAYYAFYRKFPEVHWAFLAHMVSRNGGWSMTDLNGELLPRLLGVDMRRRLFDMLEDANAFIFGDAYPQLLLYEESERVGRPLFHLLPQFGVSAFMRPVWERFWETRDPVILTMALIVNEQHYIEGRIVQNQAVQTQVLQSLPFQAQSRLQLNQVFFPYAERGGPANRQRLAGLILEDFGDLRERIEVGKRLYALLFGVPSVAAGAASFAESTPHTGSRADYWPELFAAVRERPPEADYTQRLDGERLLPGAPRLYSPRLADAWKDRPLREPERYDWFRDADEACAYISDAMAARPYEMSAEACYGLNKIELAALAKEALL